jgi:hypothetical protein
MAGFRLIRNMETFWLQRGMTAKYSSGGSKGVNGTTSKPTRLDCHLTLAYHRQKVFDFALHTASGQQPSAHSLNPKVN